MLTPGPRAVFSEQRWRLLSEQLDHMLDLPPQERSAWLQSLEPADPELAADLRRLLPQPDELPDEALLQHTAAMRLGLAPQRGLEGMTFGPYMIDRLIGEGGMGSVWLAHRNDGQFEGRVAIKLLNTALLGTNAAHRLSREGDVLARLSHPNIARLMDAGVSVAGVPYLVLDYVDGDRIDRYCDGHRLDVRARVALFLDVVAAVAHAHTHLVVHRDIKPSNVLVSSEGHVKLLDFGVAALLDGQTQDAGAAAAPTSALAMTPEFAAPEQLQGGAITTRTDVYALGTLLYVLLTQRHPSGLSDAGPAEYMRAIAETDPMPASAAVTTPSRTSDEAVQRAGARGTTPQRLRQQLSGDLDRILGKALKRDPLQRYASAADLAEDLRRYLNHLPVRARPDSWLYQARKFVRRHRAASAAIAVAVLAAGGGLLVALQQAQRAEEQARNAVAVQSFLKDLFKSHTHRQRDLTPDRPALPRDLIDLGAARVDSTLNASPQVKSEVLDTLAGMYADLTLYAEATKLWHRQLDVLHSMGQDHCAAAAQALIGSGQAAHSLGETRRRDTELDEAERILDELGDHHSRLRARLLDSQAARYAISDKPRAASLATRAVELYRESGDPYLTRALYVQARTLAAIDRTTDAIQALKESIALSKAGNERDREQAMALVFLGELQFQHMDLSQAEQTLRSAVDMALRNHGPTHAMTANARGMLADLLGVTGRTEGCITEGRAAVAALEGSAGLDNPVSGPNVLAPLGRCLTQRGNVEEGLALMDRAATVRARRFGASATYMGQLGEQAVALLDLGWTDRAREMLARADAIAPQAHPPLDTRLRLDLVRARLAMALDHNDEAARLLDPMLVQTQDSPELRSARPQAALLRAELAVRRGDADAVARLAAARAVLSEQGLERMLPLQAAALNMLEGRLQLAAGASAAALPLLHNADKVYAGLLGEQAPQLARVRGWLLRALLAAGQRDEAHAVAAQIAQTLKGRALLGPEYADLAREADRASTAPAITP